MYATGSRARRRFTNSRMRASSSGSSGRFASTMSWMRVGRARARGAPPRRGAGSRSRARESRPSPSGGRPRWSTWGRAHSPSRAGTLAASTAFVQASRCLLDSRAPWTPSRRRRADRVPLRARRHLPARRARARSLCQGQPSGLAVPRRLSSLDAGAFWAGSSEPIKYYVEPAHPVHRPVMIGVTWGATVGGAWLALPKCRPSGSSSRLARGEVRETWPLALSLALLAGTTAPIVNAIAFGNCTYERSAGTAAFRSPGRPSSARCTSSPPGLAGAGGALLPYLIPPRTLVGGARARSNPLRGRRARRLRGVHDTF